MKRCVLFVDDNKDIRELLAESADLWGWTGLQAPNGAEAWEILKTRGNEISLVVTDYQMPVKDGLWLCRQIRAAPQWMMSPAVVLISGYEGLSELEIGLNAGFDKVLSKSMGLNAIWDEIEGLMERQNELQCLNT